jgi:myo-inositol-1(or 4)-monophosphatase
MSLQDDLKFAIELARGAGKVILPHYGKVERLTKTHQAATEEAVTIADRESQRYIVQRLRQRFPSDGIIGEENEHGDNITFDCPDLNGRVWVIDPIDGTNNFVSGLDAFCVCIGLLEGGYPVLGVVYEVCRDRVYAAAKGLGAFRDDKPIHCLTTPFDSRSLLMVTANFVNKQGKLPAYAARWLGQTQWKVRCLGSAALEAVHVASGVAHAAITVNGKLWDIAAPAAIVLEAGGTVTDPAGKDVFPFDLTRYAGAKVPFVAATPAAGQRLLQEIADPKLPDFADR